MISGIHISTSKIVISEKNVKNSGLPALKENQVLTAKVIDVLSGDKMLLQIGSRQVPVRTDLLLTPGELIQLKVTKQDDDYIFNLLQSKAKTTGQPAGRINRFFVKDTDLTQLANLAKEDSKALFRFLEQIALKSGKPDISFLSQIMEKGGLLLEKKMAELVTRSAGNLSLKSMTNDLSNLLKQDLKGMLFAETASAGQGAGHAREIVSFVELIETFQQLNHQGSDTGRMILPFPILSESGFDFGQLLIDTGTRDEKDIGEKKDRMIRVSFFLQMSNLGPLRADFSILKKSMTGRFLLSDPDTCQWVESCIPDLKARLKKGDFSLRHVECETVKTESLNQNCLVESMVKDRDHMVLNIIV